MNRRNAFAVGASAVAAVALVRSAQAQDHGSHAGHGTSAGGKYAALAASSGRCVGAGLDCQTHCIDLLAKGDTSLADCAKSVRQMLAVCRGLQDLAAAESGYLPAYAKLALQVCKDCEAQCRKHADHHTACKACADACQACAAECAKVAA